jgi:tagaturonate reductase
MCIRLKIQYNKIIFRGEKVMNILNKSISKAKDRPVKVLQFGEGNFLRGFVDYMIDVANEESVFDGSVVIVKPITFGSLEVFHQQECQYTLSLRGKEEGQTKVVNRIITCVADAVDAINEYEKYEDYAKCDTLRFIVSNTTEAGIVYDETDELIACPPKTYPGKLTKFMFDRFNYFRGDISKGLILIPCELIENNGITLKNCVLSFATLWNLGDEFITWVKEACIFCSTLVDRIVTGYPKDEAEQMCKEFGYEDKLIVTGELFALWVIESDKDISKELPFDKAGLPVIFTNNQKPYRERKVRILNGAHTSFVLASYLAGNDFVKESMEDATVCKFMMSTVFDEIIPTLSLPKEECEAFAKAVMERFENPFIKHALLSISLNSVSKWKSRCMPSLKGYVEKFNALPKHLCFSLAALMSFYTGSQIVDNALIGHRGNEEYKILDDADALEFFAANSLKSSKEFTFAYLCREKFFGEDLTKLAGLVDLVASYLDEIKANGMRKAMENL